MKEMVVDIHTHCVPERMIEALLSNPGAFPGIDAQRDADGVRIEMKSRNGSAGDARRFRLTRLHTDLKARIPKMDTMGVDVQVLSPLPYLYGYSMEAEVGERWCRTFNEAMVADTAGNPERFRYLAILPMQNPSGAAAELRRTAEAGAAGAAVATHVGDAYLDDARFAPFWEAADSTGIWILLHPAVETAPFAPLRPYYLTNLIGHPMETAIAAARLMMSGTLQRYPGVRICLSHGGGALPFLLGRLEHGSEVRDEIPEQGKSLREFYQQFYFDSITHDPQALAFLVRTAGAEHVCLGTDFPADMTDANPLSTLENAPGLTDLEKSLVRSASALGGGPVRGAPKKRTLT